MIGIELRPNLSGLQRAMIDLRAKQVPFAMSLAINELAKGVAAVERVEVDKTFDTPTPFTENAFRIEVATKAKPRAVVAAKTIQAQYLDPYVVGGDRFLGDKKGMLAPRSVGVNKFGNLTKGKLAALKARPDIFIGPVRTKAGKVVNGVWQRTTGAARAKAAKAGGFAGPLKLLIQFEDTTPVRKRLPFEQSARTYLERNAARQFDAALRRANATARR